MCVGLLYGRAVWIRGVHRLVLWQTQMGWLRGLSSFMGHPAAVLAGMPVMLQQRGAVAAPRMIRPLGCVTRYMCDKVHPPCAGEDVQLLVEWRT